GRPLGPRAPRARRPHLLEPAAALPPRADARRLHRDRALGGPVLAPASPAHLPGARIRDGPLPRDRPLAHRPRPARLQPRPQQRRLPRARLPAPRRGRAGPPPRRGRGGQLLPAADRPLAPFLRQHPVAHPRPRLQLLPPPSRPPRTRALQGWTLRRPPLRRADAGPGPSPRARLPRLADQLSNQRARRLA